LQRKWKAEPNLKECYAQLRLHEGDDAEHKLTYLKGAMLKQAL